MIPLKDNHDVACFLVTKISWRGKYKRIFSIGTLGITTYNPDKLEVTNRWPYMDVVTLTSARNGPPNEFSLVMKKDKKMDTMKFSSDHKNIILTEAFKYRHLFGDKPKETHVSEIHHSKCPF
jgi:DnaJ homolog subfamily C member 13